jgi:hypothetical protein
MAVDVFTTSELELEDSHALAPSQPLKEFDILSVNPLNKSSALRVLVTYRNA